MSQASLLLMKGAREVTASELSAIPCPPAEGRWRPVPHGTVLTYATSALEKAGFGVEQTRLGVSRGDQRFFGTLVLNSPLAEGVSLAVGVRSSYDKSNAEMTVMRN